VWQLFSVKTISPGEAIRRRIVFIENNPVADPAGGPAAA
jgi:hypothetical protein